MLIDELAWSRWISNEQIPQHAALMGNNYFTRGFKTRVFIYYQKTFLVMFEYSFAFIHKHLIETVQIVTHIAN